MTITKLCNACKEKKPLSNFSSNKTNKDGKADDCKECHRCYCKGHYQSNKKQYINRNYERRKKRKEKLKLYLKDHPCIDCGNSDIRVLEFDHLEKKDENISTMVAIRGFSWNSILKEIEKCEVVCANCHKIRTYSRIQNCWRNERVMV